MNKEHSNVEARGDEPEVHDEVAQTRECEYGILTYYTDTKGIGGKLRVAPEDFVVIERSIYPQEANDGKFTAARVTLRNWETNRFVRIASRMLGISRMAVGFAGTKDKRAVTTQLFSFKAPPEKVAALSTLTDVKLENIFRIAKNIEIGELYGNDFEINIRELPLLSDGKGRRELEAIVKDTTDELTKIRGFPNFFGVQRFGAVRPITHIVGRHIVRGEFDKAVLAYAGAPHPSEPQDTREAREFLERTGDMRESLKRFPTKLVYERSMMQYLVANPGDYVGALKQLPFNLLLMFVHSYQSYLFNLILSERIKCKMPIDAPVVGDLVLPVDRNNLPDHDKWIEVNETNIEKIAARARERKAFVSALVIGLESSNAFAKGEMGEIERKIVEAEGVKPSEFAIKELPRLTTKGIRREVLAPLDNLQCAVGDDKLTLKFSLMKGEYATSLLREYMKAGVMSY